MELTEFLLARIAEDEAVARDSFYEGQHWFSEEESVQRFLGSGDDESVWMADRKRDARHVVHWQPARVLAGCEAKRRIVDLCTYEATERFEVRRGVYEQRPVRRPNDWADVDDDVSPAVLRALALPYANHPDYQPDWRP